MRIGDYQLLQTRSVVFGQGRRSVIAGLTMNILIATGELIKEAQHNNLVDTKELKKIVVRLAWELGIILSRYEFPEPYQSSILSHCLELGSLTGSISAHVKTMLKTYPIAHSPDFVEDILSLLAAIESISE